MSKDIRTRVAVVLPRDQELLVVRHVTKRDTWWCLPGGRLEFGETLGQGGVRELKEEANLDIEIIKLLYLGDFIQSGRHVLDVFFLGRITGGEMVRQGNGHVGELRFVPMGELLPMAVKPEPVVRRIVVDARDGFQPGGEYLGRYD